MSHTHTIDENDVKLPFMPHPPRFWWFEEELPEGVTFGRTINFYHIKLDFDPEVEFVVRHQLDFLIKVSKEGTW